MIVAENKIDLVNDVQARKNYQEIKQFLAKALPSQKPPIVPISAARNLNINHIIEEIVKIPVPKRDLKATPKFISIRSFDTNKSGQDAEQLRGGVIGGALIQGILKLNDIIEIRPGIVDQDKTTGKFKCYPLTTKIISLKAETNDLRYALPGGLIAIGTTLDPALTKHDRMVGQVIGYPGTLPPIVTQLQMKFYVLVNRDAEVNTMVNAELNKIIRCGAEILLTVSGCSVQAQVIESVENATGAGDLITVKTVKPICMFEGSSVAVSSKQVISASKNWRLVGYGIPQNVTAGEEKIVEKEAPNK